jgi:hypothetical protein
MTTEAAEREEVEQWFVNRGLPHFIDGYSAGTDIWTRSLPVLAIAYLAGGFNALDLAHWSLRRNLVAAAVTLAVLIAGIAIANVLRGRPAFSIPRTVGPGELALFVIGPSLPALFLGQPGDALQSMLTGIGVLLVIFVVTSYGLIPMTRWAFAQLGEQIADLGRLVVKALPLLLLFVTFLFVNTEVWQVSGNLDGLAYWLVLALFFVIGASFVLSRVPLEVAEINHFDDGDEATTLAREVGAPVAPGRASAEAQRKQRAANGEARQLVASRARTSQDDVSPPLSRRAWANIVLVMLVTQAIQIMLVAVAVGGFLVVFGVLAIDRPIVESWTGGVAHELWEPTLGGRHLLLSEELLRVAGFLAAFTALYFTVYLVTEPTYRAQFRDEVVADVRGALAARACYLRIVRRPGAAD